MDSDYFDCLIPIWNDISMFNLTDLILQLVLTITDGHSDDIIGKFQFQFDQQFIASAIAKQIRDPISVSPVQQAYYGNYPHKSNIMYTNFIIIPFGVPVQHDNEELREWLGIGINSRIADKITGDFSVSYAYNKKISSSNFDSVTQNVKLAGVGGRRVEEYSFILDDPSYPSKEQSFVLINPDPNNGLNIKPISDAPDDLLIMDNEQSMQDDTPDSLLVIDNEQDTQRNTLKTDIAQPTTKTTFKD